jgi:hypothetical protein
MAIHKQSARGDEVARAMREASGLPRSSIVDIDPEDPAQLLDDAGQFSIVDLGVEAQPAAEADAELEAAMMIAHADDGQEQSEVDEDAVELDTPDQTTADAYVEAEEDVGELYGVHTPNAEDRDLEKTPDQEQFVDSEQGENWLETLGKNATEYGAEVEREVDIVDDSDEHRGHHKTDQRDRPVADKGSGGPAGT